MDLVSEEYDLRPTKSPEELAEWLTQFHANLAERLHHGQAVLDLAGLTAAHRWSRGLERGISEGGFLCPGN